MFKNYLKIAVRNFFKNKGHSWINVFGLAVGIACCLLIFLFVKDEFTYDSYHTKADTIYKLQTSTVRNGEKSVMQGTSFPEGRAFYEDIPSVVNFARIASSGITVKLNGEFLEEKRSLIADKSLFDMLDFRLISGSLDLTQDEVLLTEAGAEKYFGDNDCIGENFQIQGRSGLETYVVKAVIADHPSNSSFDFDVLRPINEEKTSASFTAQYWYYNGWTTFIELEKGTDLVGLKSVMDEVRLKYNPGEDGPEAFAKKSSNEFLALSEMHSKSAEQFSNGLKEGVKGERSYILTGIAFLILVIACFNFSNLTFVNAISRTKEVGIRKTVGALRKNLFVQFLTEACLISVFAFILGIILAEIALPFFEGIMEKQFSRHFLEDTGLLIGSFLLVLISSIAAISYPSLVLSKLRVTSVLKGSNNLSQKKRITQMMVGLQFLMAIVFITVASGIQKQHSFLVNKELGYNDQNLIRLKIPSKNSEVTAKLFEASLITNPNILKVGASSAFNEMSQLENADGVKIKLMRGYADSGLLDAMELQLLEGRNLTPNDRLNDGTTPASILINKSATVELGLANPVGELLENGKYQIAGVFEDFQVFSAKSVFKNVLIRANPRPGNNFFITQVYVRYRPNFLADVLSELEDTWGQVLPTTPFQYEFVDTFNESLYEKEALWSTVLKYSSGLAISVSLIGVLGLIGLSANQRKKEISIRKVLGATLTGLTVLLNQGFARILIISIILSLPVTYYVIDKFLEDYVNRIEVTPWLFVIPTLVTAFLAWLIVSIVTLRSANRNPIEDLRYE